MWQIWGEAADRKALWRSDWSIKPAGQAWLDLVHRAWWTNLAGETNPAGTFQARGFLGAYRIMVKVGEQTKRVELQLAPTGKEARGSVLRVWPEFGQNQFGHLPRIVRNQPP